LLQQRQILGMKLRQKSPRGLCRWQIMPKQQRQCLVLAKVVEVFRALATGRPQREQAFHHRHCWVWRRPMPNWSSICNAAGR
jgi:hypothetical protein